MRDHHAFACSRGAGTEADQGGAERLEGIYWVGRRGRAHAAVDLGVAAFGLICRGALPFSPVGAEHEVEGGGVGERLALSGCEFVGHGDEAGAVAQDSEGEDDVLEAVGAGEADPRHC